tara:strand:+ start:1821 stop:2048 length:228 start_codon:yes stop_codon:yes gene_type:complete
MKNIIRVLFGIPVVLSIQPIIKPTKQPIDILLEALAAKHSCCEDCGYSYCPSLDDCIIPFETYCKDFDSPYNIKK